MHFCIIGFFFDFKKWIIVLWCHSKQIRFIINLRQRDPLLNTLVHNWILVFFLQKLESCFVKSCNKIIWIHYFSKLRRPILKCTCAQLDSIGFLFFFFKLSTLKYTSAKWDFCFVMSLKANLMYDYNLKLTFKHTCAHLNFFLISKI